MVAAASRTRSLRRPSTAPVGRRGEGLGHFTTDLGRAEARGRHRRWRSACWLFGRRSPAIRLHDAGRQGALLFRHAARLRCPSPHRDECPRVAGRSKRRERSASHSPGQHPCSHDSWRTLLVGHVVRLARIDVPDPTETLRCINGWPEGFTPTATAMAPKRSSGAVTDAMGLAVPARWRDAWWAGQRERGITPDQFEAVYGLLLTRGWSDAEIRSRVPPPPEAAPAWWT